MEERQGTVRISPQVLSTIARLTTLAVPGVLRMYRELPSSVDRLLKARGVGDGVRIEVVDDAVTVDLHIVAASDVSLYDLGREIQSRVARAIKDMVGMPVLAVNVHVKNVGSRPAAGEGQGGEQA
ncbi:MAG TPA: Asp23/Gls24 family envelope stress response protein [Chloroflexi bacterium]|nr:Asp23/Gls24 family envelope stress response protein [Chloroflexota bacterium]